MDNVQQYNSGRITPLIGIGSGINGNVYRIIGDNKVVKFLNRWPKFGLDFNRVNQAVNQATREFEVCRDLFSKGISVPRPYGVYRLNFARISALGNS